jgi:hypothetical protein
MRLTAYKRPEAFLATASPLLLQDEARQNLVFGVCATLMEAPATSPNFGLWIVEDAGEIVAPNRSSLDQPLPRPSLRAAAALP